MKRIHKFNRRAAKALAGSMEQPLHEPWQMLAQQQQQEGPAIDTDFKKSMLDGLKDIKGSHETLGKSLTEAMGKITTLETEGKTLAEQMIELRKIQLAAKTVLARSNKRPGEVSDDCARHLGAIAIQAAFMQGFVPSEKSDKLGGLFKDIMGVEIKTALTSSDIPLPVGYSGDVVELVGMYGAARQYGTVFPLANGSFKLPKLATDTTFTLIAGSGTVTEKSPQTAWVTFNAEKFGGLVRLPTEMDEDSIVPIGQFLARYSARNIARAEDHNFFAGTGAGSGVNGTAEGLTKSVVTDSKVVQMSTGLAAIADFTLAYARQMRTVVDASALRSGAYYFHPSLESKLASFNTSGDKPYQANGLNGATLDGFPIHWIDVLPVYSAVDAVDVVFGLFGDVSFNYLGVRGGIRFDTSKEAGFTTDEILVRALERFTIGKMATGAVAGIRTAAATS